MKYMGVEMTGYLNLKKEILDKPIYRIFPINRFLNIIRTQENVLLKPKKWDDPFENLLLKSKIRIGEELTTFAFKDDIFGQCWTWHREKDAMWRIYSSNKDGIRVRSTPRKLLQSLKESCDLLPDVSCFIGGVRYQKRSDLINSFKRINILSEDGSGIARSLLLKRIQFSHEKEVRIIYIHPNEKERNNEFFRYKINPEEIFDRILFDPRMDKYLRESYSTYIKSLGYKFDCRKSTLYDLPNDQIFDIKN